MKLSELDPHFLRLIPEEPGSSQFVDALADAQGVIFLCPVCFRANGGSVGTHSIICWFADCGVPDHMTPKPGRWHPSGTGLDDLTFVGPGATSVLLTGPGCGAHFHIEGGEIR